MGEVESFNRLVWYLVSEKMADWYYRQRRGGLGAHVDQTQGILREANPKGK